jgi:hypothetical protein
LFSAREGCWNPSTYIEDAWLVVEKLGNEFLIRKRLDGMDYRAWVRIKDKEYYAHGKKAPMAICLAALKSVGVEIEQ